MDQPAFLAGFPCFCLPFGLGEELGVCQWFLGFEVFAADDVSGGAQRIAHADSVTVVRTVVWFSCGAASAVAASLVVAEKPENLVVAYTDPGSEHPDNERFLRDVERWLGISVTRLKSHLYDDTWDVWEKRRFIVSPQGAPCTTFLKKKIRQSFQQDDDVQVFGYTADEQDRVDRFRQQNPEVNIRVPLIEYGLGKSDCLALVARQNIDLPVMYQLGYQNNNCIGCPKGGMGYWNKIRRDFPEVFNRMAVLERKLGASVLRSKGDQVFLDELDPERGSHTDEPSFECSLFCQSVEEHLGGEKLQ